MSVVVVAHNEGEHLGRTVHSLLGTVPRNAEIVVVDDDSDDDAPAALTERYPTVRIIRPPTRVGPAVARNIGARASTGSVVVFSDAHVTPQMDWVEPLVAALSRPEVGAVAPSIAAAGNEAVRGYGRTWCNTGLKSEWLGWAGDEPYPVPLLCGCFLAMRRDVFESVGGFDDGMPRWGSEDDELSVRLWLLGYECRVVPAVTVTHLFRSSFPYVVEAVGVVHNLLRMAVLHLSGPRLAEALSALQHKPRFPQALARVLETDAWSRRSELVSRRSRDDAWYFDRFSIPSYQEELS